MPICQGGAQAACAEALSEIPKNSVHVTAQDNRYFIFIDVSFAFVSSNSGAFLERRRKTTFASAIGNLLQLENPLRVPLLIEEGI